MTTQPPPTLTRIVRAGMAEEAQAVGRTVFLASDDRLDRYGTRIAQDWLEDGRMSAFDANPVVPWSHDYSQPPVGRVTSREVREVAPGASGLYVAVEWDMDDERAAGIAGKYARGVLSAVSVGFRSARVTALSALDQGHPWRAEDGYMLAGNELMEISAVTVPGNPRALAQRDSGWLAAALVEQAPDVVRAELVRLLREDQSVRAMLREIEGDTYDDGLTVAIPAAREALPVDPWAWLAGKK